MKYYGFIYLALTTFTYLFILSELFFLYTIYRRYSYTNTLSKKVYNLGKGITTEKVEDFINYLDIKHIPFRFYNSNLIESWYKLTNTDEDVDIDLNRRLKIMALSKGILVD